MNKSCMIVAEIGQAHDGSLGTAHAYIDAVAKAGADAIKFQTHIADAESTPGEPWRVNFSYQDDTRYEYWKRMSFTYEQWKGLANHAKEKGLIFFSSPFSLEAVDLLEKLGVPIIKLGAGEIINKPLIERVIETGKKIFLSTGMVSYTELDMTVDWLKKGDADFTLFQCTSKYPCPPNDVGLNVIQELKNRYKCDVGFSDHSGSIFTGLAANTLGAQVIEVHVTFSRDAFGPDVSSSITIEELKMLCDGIRYTNNILDNPVDKDILSNKLIDMKDLFYKSVVACSRIKKGEVLSFENLTVKKPGTGIQAYKLEELIGKIALKDFDVNEMIDETYIGEIDENSII